MTDLKEQISNWLKNLYLGTGRGSLNHMRPTPPKSYEVFLEEQTLLRDVAALAKQYLEISIVVDHAAGVAQRSLAEKLSALDAHHKASK